MAPPRERCHHKQVIDPVHTEAEKAIAELVGGWVAEYRTQTGNDLVDVQLGTYTYTFDIAGGRLVCATGHSNPPEGPRDNSRQKGHPPTAEGDHKGHVFAHSMGGEMDMNIVPQSAVLNLGREWRAIETLAAENPGTAVALHLVYGDDSDRPVAFEYGFDHPETGLQLQHFDNPPHP